MKKYIIEMNERQARLLSWVCDTFHRLIEGQDDAFQDLFESAWEKRCKEATGKMMDDEFGWMAEDARGSRNLLQGDQAAVLGLGS